jgi:hypothetical protein
MANNTIQIKRSAATAAPASLNAGELAYSNATGGSGVLYIGSTDGGTVVPIGGVRYPGTLTANQALVANATSGINRVVAANVDILNYLTANGGPGTSGYVLFSGGSTTNAYWGSVGSLSVNLNSQYAWTNTQSFSNTISFGSVVQVGNSSIATAANLVVQSNTASALITVANGTGGATTTTVYANGLTTTGSVNAAAVYASGIVNAQNFTTTGTVNTATVYATGLVNAANFVTTGTVNSATVYATGLVNAANFVTTGTVNTGTVYATGLVNAQNFVTTGTVNTATLYATTSANIGANVQLTTTQLFIGNATVNAIHNSSVIAINGGIGAATNGFYVNSVTTGATSLGIGNSTAYTTITGGNVQANYMSITNSLTVGGNLVVSGSVVTVNTVTLVVNDNVIELGYNNISTDTVDMGWFSPAGNATNIWYSGIARIASRSSNNNPYFWVFGSNTNPNTATTIDQSSNSVTGTLQSYLVPYGTSGGFIVNSSAIIITANASVVANIAANNLTLSTPLATTSGGTGLNTYAAGDLVYYSSGTALSKLSIPGSAANGQVLQITNNLPAWSALDGGTF